VVDSVSVLLSLDGGTTFPHVLASGEPNDSAFVWDIEGGSSQNCRIMVRAHDNYGNTSEDISDADFEIADLVGVVSTESVDLDIVSVRPNPSVGGTRIRFASPSRPSQVNLYDVTGRLVKSLAAVAASGMPEIYEAHWDGTNTLGRVMSPGVYFVRITSGGMTRSARITIAR
jgi:hypothetical protein